MPRADVPVANVRSRKASHYLGLFKENEAEEKLQTIRKKVKQAQDHGVPEEVELEDKVKQTEQQAPTVNADIEAIEDGNPVTISSDRLAHHLPLNLLDEIRNHHQLAPDPVRGSTYTKGVPLHERDKHKREVQSGLGEQHEEEEAGEEHISSAVYYPHQGLKLEDSPTEAQIAQHKQVKSTQRTNVPPEEDIASDHVEFSLRSSDGDTSDQLQGELSVPEMQAAQQFDQLPAPALSGNAHITSDSDSESDAYASGYDTVASDEDEVTPTATPHNELQIAAVRESPTRLKRNRKPAPIGAVELKPYKHQVGGHTTVYRFSRRAVCKELNSKENMFYETVERNHPELLGFMPRYIGVLNVTYRKEGKKRKPTLSESETAVPTLQEGENKPDSAAQQPTTTSPQINGQASDEQQRVFSHSHHAPMSIPQVIFENNRHLIPDDLFQLPRRSVTPDLPKTRPYPPVMLYNNLAASAMLK